MQWIQSQRINISIIQIKLFKMLRKYRKKASKMYGSDPHNFSFEEEDQNFIEMQKPIKKVKKNCFSSSRKCQNPYEKINFIPQVKLSIEDMRQDPIMLLSKLQQKYKEYGAVKLIACDQWNPPFSFKYTQNPITTRIQKIHKLQKGKAFKEKNEQYSIKTFSNYAQNFQSEYKMKFPLLGDTKELQMQNQYWKTVNGVGEFDPKNPNKFKTVVQYAADLPVRKFGSGFPLFSNKSSSDDKFDYTTSLFNLNNFYKSPNSILQIAEMNGENISGVTIPWVYMGMMFSSFCWHVEDLWLNSVNYNHKGSTKTWYIIPESDKEKFDMYVQKKTGKRQLLDSITFMIDPLELMEQGIKVYKTYQKPKEYICTLFKAYHCGFSQGFNVGQAVNFASPLSLETIKDAISFYQASKEHRPSVICYDWLIYCNIKNKINYRNHILDKEYVDLLGKEYETIRNLAGKIKVKQITLINQNSRYDRHSCANCRNYLYNSFLKCSSCNKIFCYSHVGDCCGQGLAFCLRLQNKGRKKIMELVQNTLMK